MSSIPQDVLYFLSPVNTPVYPVPENAQIVVTEARDRDATDLGRIATVTGTWHDDTRLWYRGDNGRYYDGPMIGQAVRGSYGIDVTGDEAVFGYISNTYAIDTGRSYGFTNSARWSGERVLVGGRTVDQHYGVNVVRAAPWASELWPFPGEHEDFRAAKIALAKFKWETQQKHLAIIREGQRRDWLYILEQRNFLSDHGMQRPVYGALVSANVSLPSAQQIEVDELTSRARTQLDALSQFRTGTDSRFTAQVQVPVQFVYPGNGAYREGTSIYSYDPAHLTAHFQQTANNYEVSVQAHSIQPTITGLSN